jgi:hypothetical protein
MILNSKKRDTDQAPMKKVPETKKKLRIRLKDSSTDTLVRSESTATFSTSRFPILRSGFRRTTQKKVLLLIFLVSCSYSSDLFVETDVMHS